MSKKQITLLALLVCVPLVALVWLGGRLARNERARLRSDLQDLLARQLSDANQSVDRFFQRRRRELLRVTDLEMPAASPEWPAQRTAALRATVRRHPHLAQLFVLAPDGEILHPPAAGPLNDAERAFLERSRIFLQDKDLLRAAQGQLESGVAGSGASASGESGSAGAHGWYAWHWGRGVQLVFWRRLPSGHVVGAELDRARWMSDLVAELPQTPLSEAPSAQSRIQLVDSQGQAVYQWGAFEPPRDAAPLAELPVSSPLSAWRLKLHVADDRFSALAGRSADFNFLAGLSAVGVALLTLGLMFYRESSRESREAATRINFVNQVSHELKTPLTNIRMYAELLAERFSDSTSGDASDREDASRRLEIIIAESCRLSRLIGNVLTFSQQQRRQVELKFRPGRIDDTIQKVIDQFQPMLAAQGVATTFVRGAGAGVCFDADAVEQILVNLLSNVEKYAAQGGRLRIASHQDGERTTIRVADAGPGIPPALRDAVFQPFFRMSNRLDKPAGTGIGLSIARGLARLHQGDLRLEDSAVGATFQLDLHTPLDQASDGAESMAANNSGTVRAQEELA